MDEASNPLDRLHVHHLHHTRCQAIPRREKILVHALNIRKTVDGRKESGNNTFSCPERHQTADQVLALYANGGSQLSQRALSWPEPKLRTSNIVTCNLEVAGPSVICGTNDRLAAKPVIDCCLSEQEILHVLPWFLSRLDCRAVDTDCPFDLPTTVCLQRAHLLHHIAKMNLHMLVHHENCRLQPLFFDLTMEKGMPATNDPIKMIKTLISIYPIDLLLCFLDISSSDPPLLSNSACSNKFHHCCFRTIKNKMIDDNRWNNKQEEVYLIDSLPLAIGFLQGSSRSHEIGWYISPGCANCFVNIFQTDIQGKWVQWSLDNFKT
ncbi:hypothetical protein PHYBLDRAFT_58522 [Phycomyces blakesleeanus NRRL 1555(-)]|uniref:Uncharacterized protein n=1 Tax=Phycomyces blakesleeanus (strain ATCC 8743b / DSM 1359 / FGSC 10004 / NBRC 33097 / NRRL 1555) TaxID=763407 RepID=A0A167QCC9_PHYB8|nr:hypothetical protein PHYBLDRAFT_58522 [Phycomyces blakesleeanus NRRL 1555(-)]OAD79474.1 hypothetical protein PHYBLDRAFT_58522 [Phycomyces blakesleeanus NRRL 1555(-)]|eukprot:XP_018297514.1 hypothetical protein PHYBLDRAFT_58522 [Phycomyces blakesleeanus NRRL 1555(-)]